ncbi:MAG TPA: hypothetical protein VIG33_00830, partial [Pseudobdellovibrionaceae bacterium]
VTTAAPLDATKLPLAGGTMSGAIAMGGFDMTNAGNITMANNKYFGLSSNATPSTVAGQMWYDSGTIKYYNGSSVQSLGVAGVGITSLNGLTSGTQTFAIGTSGNSPAFSSATSTHTLNIPMASTASVTAGLISKTDYDAFNAKLSAVSDSASLTAGKVWVGNASNAAVEQTLSGDATMTSGGVVTVDKTQSAVASKILQLTASSVAVTKGTDIGGAGSGVAHIVYPNTATNTTLTLPSSAGSASQFLQTDGAGSLTWATALSSSTGFVNGGNTFAGNSSIGNNDNYNLDIKTNNTSRMTILNNGNVGIGTTTPGSLLDVKGTLRLSGSTSGYVGFAPAAAAGSTTYTLPTTQGSAGQFLTTDGVASTPTLSWATPSASLPSLASAKIWVGNASGAAAAVSLSGDIASVSDAGAVTLNTVPTTKGGTGLTSAGTANQILGMNNGATALEYKTITAGSGVTVTHGANSVTIAATGSGGTVTSVSGTAPISVATGTTTPVISITAGSTTGQGLRWNGSAWAAGFIALTDLRSTVTGVNSFASSCSASQTLTYNSVGDVMSCANIAIANTQVSGLGTLSTKSAAVLTTDVSGILPVANGGTGTSNGSITGTGALTFTAGGTNQDVTITASGTGKTVISSAVVQLSGNSGAITSGVTTCAGLTGAITRDSNGDLYICK